MTRAPRIRNVNGYGQVSLGGKNYHLGKYGSEAAKQKFKQLVNEWAQRESAPRQAAPATVREVSKAYYQHAKKYYRKNGKPTRTVGLIRDAIHVLWILYKDTPATEFGPLAFKAVRNEMIDRGWCRKTCNDAAQRIVRMFRWAAGEELVPGSVVENLKQVESLKSGRTRAKDHAPVRPVADEIVDATLPHLPEVVADMVRIQRLTGARPTEVCNLRPCDVERDCDVWTYRPGSHKTEHHGKERLIPIGPKAQLVLMPYLLRPAESYCFSPAESATRFQSNRERTTPLNQGNRAGYSARTRSERKSKRQPKERYTRDSYRRAIHRVCDKHGIEKWSPNRLRHSRATEIRRDFGLEGAQVVLGHSNAAITQLYAERDAELAKKIAKETG